MFSDTRLFHCNNGLVVPTEGTHTGSGGRTVADAPQADGRKDTGLSVREEFEVVQGIGVHPVMGQSPERKLLFVGPWHRGQTPAASHSPLGEHTSPRWNHVPDAGQRCSPAGTTCYRMCSCAGLQHQTASHPFLRKYMLPPPAPHRGQEHHREPGYVSEKQFWGYPREKYLREAYACGSGHPTKHFKRYYNLNSNFCHGQESYRILKDLSRPKIHPEKVCNGPKSCQGGICSSKGSQSQQDNSGHQSQHLSGNHITCVPSKAVSEGPSPQKILRSGERKRRQPSVRDQIRLVVADLEDVLGGLKQVHLEMKEVVQQIELLTSNIDLSEEEPANGFPSNTICSSSSSGVVVSCQKRAINQELKMDPGPTGLQNTTTQMKPPGLTPSITVPNEAGPLVPCKASPQHMPSIPFVERLCSTSQPGDRKPEAQSAGDHLGPALSRTALQTRHQTAIHGGPETTNPRPRPYHHGEHTGMNAKVDNSVNTPQCVGKRQLLSTMV